MADFEVDISQWVAKAKAKQTLAVHAIGEALLTRIKELTPVDTGRLRSSWQLEDTPEGCAISTNVVYARRIDEGFVGVDSLGRRFDQPGHRMVEQTIVETPQIAAQAIKDLS